MKRGKGGQAPTLANGGAAGQARGAVVGWIPACLWGLLAALTLWRTILAGQVLHADLPTLQGAGGVVIQWRQLDGLLAWVAMAMLLAMQPGALAPGGVRDKRLGMVLAAMLAVGAVCAGLAVALGESAAGESGAAEALGFWGDGLLAGCGLFLAGREIRRMMRQMEGPRKGKTPPAGLTLPELWRFIAVQWGLLMVAALLYLRVKIPAEDIAASEHIRRLEFFLPAAGAIPNAMMAGGIMGWDWILRTAGGAGAAPRAPRMRAWLSAMAAVNLAGVLLALRPAWAGMAGGIVALAAIALYLLGFPREAWRGTGAKAVLMAWAIFAVAMGAQVLERIWDLANNDILAVSTFYGAAWRHLWSAGAVTLWLMGTGLWLIERLPAGRGVRRAGTLAMVLLFAGALVTAAVFLIAAGKKGEAQLPAIQWLMAGMLPETLALLIAGAATWRALTIFRRSGP